jgi:hypothetical protein
MNERSMNERSRAFKLPSLPSRWSRKGANRDHTLQYTGVCRSVAVSSNTQSTRPVVCAQTCIAVSPSLRIHPIGGAEACDLAMMGWRNQPAPTADPPPRVFRCSAPSEDCDAILHTYFSRWGDRPVVGACSLIPSQNKGLTGCSGFWSGRVDRRLQHSPSLPVLHYTIRCPPNRPVARITRTC